MIDITGILTIAFIRICVAQLYELERRHQHKAWIKIIVEYARGELRSIRTRTEYGADVNEGKNMSLKDEQFYAMVCDLKQHLDPADYLFLKSLFTEDDNDRIFFLEQACMISPENLRLQVISTFINQDIEDDPEKLIGHLNSLTEHSAAKDIKEYVRILEIIMALSDEHSVFRPLELAQFLNNCSLRKKAKFSLLHHITEKADAHSSAEIINHLNANGTKYWIFEIVKANVAYDLGDYEYALKLYKKIENYKWESNSLQKLEIQYKLSTCLRETSNEGQAIMMLREILFSGDYNDCGHDDFFHAIADLTAYYVRIRQAEEADRVLNILHPGMMDYMETLSGEPFLVIMADKALLEADLKKALHFYRKAYDLSSNPDIGEKICALEKAYNQIEKRNQ